MLNKGNPEKSHSGALGLFRERFFGYFHSIVKKVISGIIPILRGTP